MTTPFSWMASAVSTDADIALVCRLSLRRAAVTTTSSSFSPEPVFGADVCAETSTVKREVAQVSADKERRHHRELGCFIATPPDLVWSSRAID